MGNFVAHFFLLAMLNILILLSSKYVIFTNLNLLEPEFYIKILAHPGGKMRIIQEPNKVAL